MKSDRVEKLWTTSFVLLTLCYFLLFLSLQMLLAPLPGYVKERFQTGDFTVSLVTGLFALSAIGTRFATAALMRSIRRSVILYAGIIIAAVITAAYAYAGSAAVMLLLRVLFGVGFGMASTVIPTLVSQLIPASRIGEGIGYFGFSTSLAMSVGPIVGLQVMAASGFPRLTVYGAIVVALMLPLLLLGRCIPPDPVRPDRHAADAAVRAPRQPAKRGRFSMKLLLPALLTVLLSVTYGGLLGFLALFGREQQLANVGVFFLCNAVSVFIIRPLSGRLFDRKGEAAVLLPAAAFVMAALIVLSYASSVPLLIAAGLLYGLGFGAIQPTAQAWMLRETAAERHGAANSLFYNATDFGIAAGSMLLGVIASYAGYSAMYRYAAGFVALFVVVYGISRWSGRRADRDAQTGQAKTRATNASVN